MSLRGDKYETHEEVKARLEQTVVMYDNEPVYIAQVLMPKDEDGKEIARVIYRPLPLGIGAGKAPEPKFDDNGRLLPQEKGVRKYLSSRKFDLTPFKMGYMNWKGNAVYVERVPMRQYKQGLSAGTTMFNDIYGYRYDGINFNHAIASPAFVDMVKGKYPTFKDAGAMINDKTKSVAISRNFAFVIDTDLEALFLYHNNVKCGFAFKGDANLRIAPKFHFLKEEMEENRIPIG